MNYDYERIDRVLTHLGNFSRSNAFYGKLIRQYKLLGYLTERQLACVERDMNRDIAQAQREIREWNSTH